LYALVFVILCHNRTYGQDTLTTKKIKPAESSVVDLTDQINITPFILRQSNGFRIGGLNNNKTINYSPNDGVSLGVRFHHKWLGLALAYSPRKLQDADIGQSDFINILLNSYGKKVGFDLYYLTYNGYLIENFRELEKIPASNDDSRKNPLRFRYDLHTLNTGANVYYIFNSRKYSYRSTFLQNEWQQKTAGSFMLTFSLNYYELKGDSSILPLRYDLKAGEENQLVNGRFLSFAFLPGYSFTLVAFKHLFLTLSPSIGVMVQQQYYTTQTGETIDRVPIILRTLGRSGVGYNSRYFYAGLTSVTDVYNIPLASKVRLENLINNFTIYAGFRLNVPKPLKKYSDWLGKLSPGNIFTLQLKK
jgi:hypothetical protein